tara:strand:- start:22794 stop:23678 length:885 start_codon:yes stop_codon:yes gene_type:complete
LAWLEEQLKRPLHECFDLIAGTSIGGILAIGVATGKPTSDLLVAFSKHGPKIFGKDRKPKGKIKKYGEQARKIMSARYSQEPLRAAIIDMIGEDATWNDLKTKLLVPAVCLQSGGPQFFRSYKIANDIKKSTLTELALATSAAPTYFPTSIVGARSFVDGGLVANAPDVAAIIDAEKMIGASRDRIHVLAVGTTHPQLGEALVELENRGIYDWEGGAKVVDLTLSSQEALTREMAETLLGSKRYFYIDQAQSTDQQAEIALDCASPQATASLNALAANTIDNLSVPTWLKSISK